MVDAACVRSKAVTLGAFVDAYIAEFAPTVKKNTVITWKQCRRLLLEKFSPDLRMDRFTGGHAIRFRNHLLTRGNSRVKSGAGMKRKNLAETTVRKRCACAKQFFAYAVAEEIISKNPFDSKKIPTNSFKVKDKDFVGRDLSWKILSKLPNSEWRLLFALARFGGLRIPSEPQGLRWQHIDWKKGRMIVHSPKTEHHKGHETRTIPIFPDLRRLLLERREECQPGDELVLPMLKGKSNSYCRKPVIKAIEFSGVTVWEDLFNTLRATFDTELRDRFPGHVVDVWTGHSERVAKRHYSQVTEEHFARAIGGAGKSNPPAQSHAQSPAVPCCTERHQGAKENGNPNETAGIAVCCGPVHQHAIGLNGGDRNRTCTSEETGS